MGCMMGRTEKKGGAGGVGNRKKEKNGDIGGQKKGNAKKGAAEVF